MLGIKNTVRKALSKLLGKRHRVNQLWGVYTTNAYTEKLPTPREQRTVIRIPITLGQVIEALPLELQGRVREMNEEDLQNYIYNLGSALSFPLPLDCVEEMLRAAPPPKGDLIPYGFRGNNVVLYLDKNNPTHRAYMDCWSDEPMDYHQLCIEVASHLPGDVGFELWDVLRTLQQIRSGFDGIILEYCDGDGPTVIGFGAKAEPKIPTP